MNSLLLPLLISITASLGAVPSKNSPIKNNIINGIPVTATSSIPEGGGEHALDTTLKFSKTDQSDTNEYCYSFSCTPKMIKPFYDVVGGGESASYEEAKKWILENYAAEWKSIDFSSQHNDNLFESIYTFNYYYLKLGLPRNDKLVSLWVTKKDENGDPDYAHAFEAASTLNYAPGITDYTILPDYAPIIGEAPITHYDSPSNQYSADFTWFKGDTQMAPGAVFEEANLYTAKFSITINSEFKPMPSPEGYFSFGRLNTPFAYDSEENKYVSEDYVFPLVSQNKNTILCGTYLKSRTNAQNFCIYGNFNGLWKQTTFANEGFATFLYEGDDVTASENYKNAMLVPTNITTGTDSGSFNIKSSFKHLNDDNVLQVNYTVTNKTDNEKTFSLGSTADIQIGGDDNAICYPFSDGSGFKMVSNKSIDIDDKGGHAQVNFWCKNSKDVTDVDHFWYGAYNENTYKQHCTEAHKPYFLPWRGETEWSDTEKKCVFLAEEINRLSAYDKTRWDWTADPETGLEKPYELDSAMAWSWTNRKLQAHETKTYSVLFSIGGPGSEDIVTGDFTNIRTVDDTITYSGTETFNVTKIEVNGTTLDSSCFKVDANNKTITFFESANLKPGEKVIVYLNNHPINVRNNISPKGPSAIQVILNDTTDPIDLKEGNNKVFFNDDGTRSDTETNRFAEYNYITGKLTLQNVPSQNKLIIPSDVTVPNGQIKMKVTGENTINNINSAYPIIVYSDNNNDTLLAQNVSTTNFAVEKCKCTITATGDQSCLNGCNEISVKDGDLALNSDNIAIVANGTDLKIAGSMSINGKTGIDNTSGNVLVSGQVNINATECGIKCDTLSIVDECELTINIDTSKALSVNKIVIPEGYEVIGGSIDDAGHFVPKEGATQLIIHKGIPPIPPAPVTNDSCFTHWILLALLIALVGFTLILWFAFKIKNFKDKEKNKLNIAPIIGFSLHLVGVIIAAIFMHCVACYVLLAINLAVLAGVVALYIFYKQKNKNQNQSEDQQKEDKEEV